MSKTITKIASYIPDTMEIINFYDTEEEGWADIKFIKLFCKNKEVRLGRFELTEDEYKKLTEGGE